MKFTLSWLKTHLETDATLQQITDTLTRIGLELEDVEDRGGPGGLHLFSSLAFGHSIRSPIEV